MAAGDAEAAFGPIVVLVGEGVTAVVELKGGVLDALGVLVASAGTNGQSQDDASKTEEGFLKEKDKVFCHHVDLLNCVANLHFFDGWLQFFGKISGPCDKK